MAKETPTPDNDAEPEGQVVASTDEVTPGQVPPGTTVPPVDPNPEEPVVVAQTWDTDAEGAPIEADEETDEEAKAKDNRAKSPNPSDRARKGDDEEG